MIHWVESDALLRLPRRVPRSFNRDTLVIRRSDVCAFRVIPTLVRGLALVTGNGVRHENPLKSAERVGFELVPSRELGLTKIPARLSRHRRAWKAEWALIP
jgi:hypothetical protein